MAQKGDWRTGEDSCHCIFIGQSIQSALKTASHQPMRCVASQSRDRTQQEWPPGPAPLASSSFSPCVPSLCVMGNTALEGDVTTEVALFSDVTLLWLVFFQEYLDVTSCGRRYVKVSPVPRVHETRYSSTARVLGICRILFSQQMPREAATES